MRPKSLDDVFNAPELSVSDIQREIGVMGIRAVLSILISDVVLFFNVGKTMDDNQTAITCDLIIEAYPYFKIEDFKLCFKNAMMLKYGKLYDRIDGAVIIGWLKEYDRERIESAMVVSNNEVKLIESNFSEGVLYQDYLSNLKQRAESGDENAKERLEEHLKMKSFLKNRTGYDKYSKERDRKRLNGRGIGYEKQFNRNLSDK